MQNYAKTRFWRSKIMEKPIVLVIMDGVGKGDGGSGDAVKVANTPTLDLSLIHISNKVFSRRLSVINGSPSRRFSPSRARG